MKQPSKPIAARDDRFQRFAEQFVKHVLDPRQPWMIQYILAGGFGQVPNEKELATGGHALDVINCMDRDWFQPVWLVDALYSSDSPKLIPYFRQRAMEAGLTDKQLDRLLRMADPVFFKQSLKELVAPFKFHRGPKPKIPVNAYGRLLEIATLLTPALCAILTQQKQTTHSISAILEYLRKDHPQASNFLSDHINRLIQAMNDPKILRRAQTRLEARARVLADALAGTDFGLTFSTSVERVREARRRVSQKSI